MSDDDFFDLPEDPYVAFVTLEREFRGDLQRRLDTGDNDSPYFEWYQDYINQTLGAARGLGLSYFDNFSVPTNERSGHADYRDFVLAVDQLKMQIRVRQSRRNKRYSVALDSVAKEKIRHHLGQLKELAEKLELEPRKREAIFSKILALEEELLRERTRFDVVASLILDGATVVGVIGDKLSSWERLLNSIARVVGIAKDNDTANPSLPAPEDRKQIEPPKHNEQTEKRPSFGRSAGSTDFDDEIPF